MSIKERYAGYADALHTLPFLADYSDTVQYTFHYSALKGIEKDVIHHNLDGIVGTVKKIQEMPQAFVCSNDEAAVLFNSRTSEAALSYPGRHCSGRI